MSEQGRRLEDLEAPRGGLPGVFEGGRDFAGRHGAAVEINREQHAPPGWVRQRGIRALLSRTRERIMAADEHGRHPQTRVSRQDVQMM